MAYLLALSIVLTPLYVWRFTLGAPVNFFLLWVAIFWLFFIGWLLHRRQIKTFVNHVANFDRKLLLLTGLFFLAGLVSLFVGAFNQAKLGQFVVLFLQPISLFFISDFVCAENPQARSMIRRTVYFLVAVNGILAIVQYFTLWTLPAAYWGNAVEPKRAVGMFGQPDMFGLFITPLLAWLLPDVLRRLAVWRQKSNVIVLVAWLLGCCGLLLGLSRGAWLGFGLATLVGLIAFGRKKYLLGAVGIGLCALIIIAAVPNWRYRLILPFKGEKSSVARLSLWHTGAKMVHDSPIVGKGLTGFGANWYAYNTDPNLDHYNFPHNLWLSLWVDTGLLGMLSFAGIVLYGWWYGFKNRGNTYALGLALFLLALVAHGLIDTPYLKNDLATIFWLIWGISRTNQL